MSYAETETALIAALAAEFTSARVTVETPDNLAEVLPCIRVTRFAGASDPVAYTFDNASVDFDCFGATRQAAQTLAYQVRTFVRGTLPGMTVGGAFFARTQDIQGPTWTPYNNPNVRRFTYSAAIRLHSLAT